MNGMTKLLRGGIVVSFDNRPTALRLHGEIQEGFETFEDLISSGRISCDI